MKSPSDLKEQILFALEEEPNLTAEQLIELTGAKPDTVRHALKRLKDRKLIVATPIATINQSATGSGRTYFHKLSGDKRRAVSDQSWKHEIGLGWLYVSLCKLGIPFTWIHTSDQKDGFRFDRALHIFGKQFYIERERGSQELPAIIEKVKNYIWLNEVCHVIFTVDDFPGSSGRIKKTAKEFGAEILDYLKTERRRTQFVVAPHARLVANPLDECLVSPEPAKYSLESIK